MQPNEFDDAIQVWGEKPRGEKQHYYDTFLWPEVQRRFAEHREALQIYDVLIIPVSNPYTAMLHLEHYHPKVAVFLYTGRSRNDYAFRLQKATESLDIIYDDNGSNIDATDTLSVYRAVKSVYERYQNQRIAVDITGGTKAMSVGVAMAGSVTGADSIYIESKFDRSLQDRLPGSEQANILPDPYTTLGDIQRQRAFSFYKSHDYSTAQVLFSELANRVDPPQGDLAWAQLASAYAAWDSFNLEKAEQELSQIVEIADLLEPLSEARPRLQEQIQVIQRVRSLLETRRPNRPHIIEDQGKKMYTEPVNRFIKQQIDRLVQDQVASSLLATFYVNALRREEQQRLDTAALLLYRCLEFMSQHRLAQVGILAEFPIDRVKELRKTHTNLKMPKDKIALLQGYKLLCTLNDDFASRCDVANIQQQTNIRNQSILAHGFNFISNHDYRQFRATVDEVIQHWCDVERYNGIHIVQFARFYKYGHKE